METLDLTAMFIIDREYNKFRYTKNSIFLVVLISLI